MKLLGFMIIALSLGMGVHLIASPLVNGDFEDGLNGWTKLEVGATMFASTTNFLTTNGGPSSNSAFLVPNADATGGDKLGLVQDVVLQAGILNIAVNAVAHGANGFQSTQGGLFSIILDGVILSNTSFGDVPLDSFKFVTPAVNSLAVTAGVHTIGFQMTNFGTNSRFVDNFVISGSATEVTVVPEPNSLALLFLGFALIITQYKKKQ